MEYDRRKTLEQRDPKKPYMLNVKQSAQLDPNKHQYWYSTQRIGKNQKPLGGAIKIIFFFSKS